MNEENPMFMCGDGITAARSAELDEPEMVTCPICEQEVPDEECRWGVCDKCLAEAETFENSLRYGSARPASVEINALYEKVLSPEEIDALLRMAVLKLHSEHPLAFRAFIHAHLTDDSSDFADWLKEREKR